MPENKDKTYSGGMLPEAEVTATNLLKKKLLNTPGAYYYHHPAYWGKAMRYMRLIGDKKAEQRIFNKSFNYGRESAAKKVLLLMGGVVGVLYAPAIIGNVLADTGYWLTATRAGKTALNLYKATTYWRMGINAATQGLMAQDTREIDYFSVAAEAMPLWANSLSPMVEFRPFSRRNQFRCVLYNKSVTETTFDITAQTIMGAADTGISNFIKKSLGKELEINLINKLMNNFAFPIYNSGFQLGTKIITDGTKKELETDRIK